MIGYEVVETTADVTAPFVLRKHYARRPAFALKHFALVHDGMVQGVAVYGSPPLMVQKHAFAEPVRLLELSRVVVQTPEKNAASFLVGRSLQMLPAPSAVVSYADSEQGHCGIIYQATNWLYTGSTVSHDKAYIVDGKRVHPRSLASRGITSPAKWAKDNNIETVAPMPKHRYFFFVGSKQERKRMRNLLKYPVLQSYPKSDQQRYDDGPKLWVPAAADLRALL